MEHGKSPLLFVVEMIIILTPPSAKLNIPLARYKTLHLHRLAFLQILREYDAIKNCEFWALCDLDFCFESQAAQMTISEERKIGVVVLEGET